MHASLREPSVRGLPSELLQSQDSIYREKARLSNCRGFNDIKIVNGNVGYFITVINKTGYRYIPTHNSDSFCGSV